jgi:transposase-like protein
VAESDPFKWRHYQGEIILLCIRWYLRYALSYRDLEEMMRERGLSVDHTPIYVKKSLTQGIAGKYFSTAHRKKIT